MATTFKWSIDYLDTKLHEDSLEKVVKSCRYTIVAVSDDDPSIIVSDYGYSNFETPSSDDFALYDDLTEEQVLGWVWASGVKESREAGLEDRIYQIKNPPTVILQKPWENVPVVPPVEPPTEPVEPEPEPVEPETP